MKLHLPLLLRKALLLACILPSYSNTLWDPYYKIDHNLDVEAKKLTGMYEVGSIELKNGIELDSCTINFSGLVKGDVSTVKDSQLLANQSSTQYTSVGLKGTEFCYALVYAPNIDLSFDTITLRKDETDKTSVYTLSGDEVTLFVDKLLDGGIIEANQQVCVNGALGQLEVKNAVFKTPTLILQDIITLAGVVIQGPEETAGTNNMVTFEGVRSASGVLVKNMSVTINHGARFENDPYEPCFSGEIYFENVEKFKTDKGCGEQFFKDVRGHITNYDLVSLGGFSSKEDGVLLSFGNEGFTFDGKRETSAIVIGWNTAYRGGGFNGVDKNEGYKYLMYAKGPLTLCHNDHISISYNEMVNPSESQRAAAIFVDNGTLFIYDNYKVIFESNIVYPEQIEQEMVYTPLVPYAIQSVGNNNIYLITNNLLSSIEFYQPVNIKGFLHLNGGHIDANQKEIVGFGEILFSGTKADAYLAAQLGLNVDALKLDPERIQARLDARTSNVNGDVTLYSGSLKIVNDAILNVKQNLCIQDGASLFLEPSTLSATPVFVVDKNLSLSSNTKLVVKSNDAIEKGKISPLLSLKEESQGDQGSSPNKLIHLSKSYDRDINFSVRYDSETREKLGLQPWATLSDIIPWSAWTDGKQGFSYVSESGTAWDPLGELTWIGETLYLRRKEDGSWWYHLKNGQKKLEILDSDKRGVETQSVGQNDNTCFVRVAANVLTSFFSSKTVLMSEFDNPSKVNSLTLGDICSKLVKEYYVQTVNSGTDPGFPGHSSYVLSGVLENNATSSFTYSGTGNFLPIEIKNNIFAPKEKTWTEKYGVKVSVDLFATITIDGLVSNLAARLGTETSSPVAISIRNAEKQVGHELTCWGYEVYEVPHSEINSEENKKQRYIVLYITDSDSDPHNGKKYSELWLKEKNNGLIVVQYNGLSYEERGYYLKNITSIINNSNSNQLLQSENLYQDGNIPLTWNGSTGAWTATGREKIAADGVWSKSVGEDIWANAYIYDDASGNMSDAYHAFALSQTSFEFDDEVDGDVLSTSEKYVKLAGDLEVKDVYVKGHRFTFGGTGTLDSTRLEISGSLALSDGVQIVGTPIKVVGGSLNAQVAGQTTIKGGGITLTDHGVLHGAAFRYADGKFALSNTSLSENLIFSDGSGILSATVDFGGNKVAYSTLAGLNENAELNTLFYNTVNGWGGVHQFLYSYEAQNAEVEGKASSLNSQVALKGSSLSLSGSSNAAIAIGSYFSSAQETSSVIALSEQAGGTVNAAGVKLTTVADESSYFSAASQVSGRELTIVRGSSLTNDGNVRGNGMQIVVETGAQLGGSGQFAGTQVQAGGSLMVGNSPGAPVYEVLTLNSGAILQFCLDGSEAASATAHGWGSGTHSVLTVTGDLVLAEGVDVQVGCSLDFLNAVALGETQTLTLIQLSETASADLLETLQSGTEFLWADGDAFKALTEVGASIRDVSWSAGSGNTLQLSFTVSSCPEGDLRWTNAGGDGVWDAVTQNWQDSSGTGTTFAEGKSVSFYDGGTVRLQGELNPETVVVSTPETLRLTGSGSLVGEGTLHKEAGGALIIETNNSYTGGTTLMGGSLTVAHTNALGYGAVRLYGSELIIAADDVEHYISSQGESTLTVKDGYTLSLIEPIYNTGMLTITGTLDVTALAPDLGESEGERVDVNNQLGRHGFLNSGGASVVVVESKGMVLGEGATVLANGYHLILGSDGIASMNGERTNYSSYYAGIGHSVTLSSIVGVAAAHGCKNTTVELNGGTLTADCVQTGSIITEGESYLIAKNWSPTEVIQNKGTLHLSGNIDISETNLEVAQNTIYINVNDEVSTSGFARTDTRFTLVNGGAVVDDGISVYDGDDSSRTYSMGSDGVVVGVGETDYSCYYLTGGDCVSMADIMAKSAYADVVMNGGRLLANYKNFTLNEVHSTGGEIQLSAGYLYGSISGTRLSITGGALYATLSGENTLIGNNTLDNTLTNKGALYLGGTLDVTRVGEMQYLGWMYSEGGTNGFILSDIYGVLVFDNTGTLYKYGECDIVHDGVSLILDGSGIAYYVENPDYATYYVTSGHTATASDIVSKSGGMLKLISMTGGTLNANADAQVAATGGSINLSAGELSGSISGATLSITGGSLTATLTGTNTLSGDNKLFNVLDNEGTLNISGTLDVSGVGELSGSGDVYSEGGRNGFKTSGSYSIKLVENSGAINSSATITHGDIELTLGQDGVAVVTGGSTDYSTYYIGGGHTAAVSDMVAKSGGQLEMVSMSGGTLNANADAEVAATGGNINLSAGELSGSISGATLSISGGTLSATLTGTNTLSGHNALFNVLDNDGTLNISGTLDVSGLGELNTTGDTYSAGGNNGFETSSSYSIKLVENSGTIHNSATITHGDIELTLGQNGMATAGGSTDYRTYYITGGHTAAVNSIVSQSGGKLALISMSGGTLNANADAAVAATGGSINLSSGELSGSISGATLSISGGSLTATLTGTNTLSGSNKLFNVLDNDGTLNISGTLDVSGAGALTYTAETYSEGGSNGFKTDSAYSIKLVENSGTINNTATIIHGDITLTLGNNGMALAGGSTDYSTYYIGGGHTASVSEMVAKSGGQLELVSMSGGTLNANADAAVAATGGNINLSAGELSGSISGATLSITGGTLSATLTGTNTLSGANKLFNVLDNDGTLNISGTLDVSGLGELNTTGDTYSAGGSNGFKTSSSYSIKLVENSGTINNSATITHGDIELTLGQNGMATAGGSTDYRTYYITGGHTAAVNSIVSQSGGKLALISMSGGTLNANADAQVAATGGSINLSSGELSGSISGATLSITGGTLTATLTGTNTLSGANKLFNVLDNDGTLNISGTLDVSGAGVLAYIAESYSEGGSNGFKTDSAYSIKLVENSGTINNTATIKHGDITLTLGQNGMATAGGSSDYTTYYISGGHTAVVSDMVAKSGGQLEMVSMSGGTLNANADATVAATGGNINLSAGELSGSISGATLSITGGTLSATLTGTNTLSGHNALFNVLDNDGTLNISGTLDVSGLGELNTTGDTYSAGGSNGFKTSSSYSIKLVENSGTLNSSATITHGDIELTLGQNGMATAGGNTDYRTYYITGGHTAAVNSIVSQSSGKLTLISMSGGTLNANADAQVAATGGSINLSAGELSGSISGATLSITGGTLSATLTGTNTLSGNNALFNVLTNTGTLNISGTLDVSGLGELSSTGDTYTEGGSNGFKIGSTYGIKLVENSGTINNTATIKHGDITLTLGNNGMALAGGSTDYSTYYIGGGHTASVSEMVAKSGGKLELVSMSGGTLNANADAAVAATGGSINLSTGELSGSISGATLSITGGTLSATLTGTNALSGHNALFNVLDNDGTLNISGTLDVSGLGELNTTGVTYTAGGSNGFKTGSSYSIKLVENSGTINNSATITHGDIELTLGQTGMATAAGTTDYGTYYITTGHKVAVSAILRQAGDRLQHIDMLDGVLTVDGSARVEALGGELLLSGEASLSGTLNNVLLTSETEDCTVSVDAVISGGSSISMNGGELTLSADNSYTGNTYVKEGVLKAAHKGAFGKGDVVLNGGVLDMGGLAITNDVDVRGTSTLVNDAASLGVLTLYAGELSVSGDRKGHVTLQGGTLNNTAGEAIHISDGVVTLGGAALAGDFTMDGSAAWVVAEDTHVAGSLTLAGDGTLTLMDDAALTIDGTLNISDITLNLAGKYSAGEVYTLISAGNITGDVADIVLNGYRNYEFSTEGGNLLLQIIQNEITWTNTKKAVWKVGEGGWQTEEGEATTFADGNDVRIGDGTVSIVGNVAPGDVLLAPTKTLTLKTTYDKKNKKYSGAIVGSTTAVTIAGGAKGKVTMNDGNTYGGGTRIESGVVRAGGSQSFGTGIITITGGSLDLKNKAVANDILLDGAAIVKTGKSYTGSFTMAGGELLKGSVIKVVGSTLLGGGVVNGTLSGPGEVKVSGSTVTLGRSAKVTTDRLTIANQGVLEVGTKGLTLKAKTSTVSISSGTLISASKMGAYSLTMNGGLVDITNAKPVAMTLTDALTMSNGAEVNLYGAFTAADMKLTDAHFILGMAAADKSKKNKPKTQNFTLKNKNTLSIMENSDLQIDGNMSVAGRLKLTEDSSIRLADPNGKAGMNLTVTGALDLESSSDIHLTGKLSASTLTMLDGSTVVLESEKLKSIKLNHATGTSKLTESTLKANAGMTVKGNLVMSDAHIHLWDAAVKPKAATLTVGGELKMSNGSSLTLDCLLKVGELTLNGATLNLTSTKWKTIVISDLLTITGSNDVNFGFSVSQKDVDKKKSFTLFRFKKTFLTNKSDLYGLLGLDDEYCTLSIDTKKNTITMTVTDWEDWEAYVQQNREDWAKAAAEQEEDEQNPGLTTGAESVFSTSSAEEAALAKVCDSLIQTTWGAAKASRAFVGSIESRAQNAAALAGGRGAAWGAALGSSSRLSSHGGGQGADYNMSGAAVGAEISATEQHNVGVAMGCTWGKVSTFSAYAADQDTTHVALYGSSRLKQTANGGLTLDWSAAYGRSENEADLMGGNYDWTQHSAQLDARLSYARALNERTVVRAFGGLQYLHVDAATPTAGAKADSMENLRVELGVGATWMATAKTALNGEVGFIGDLLRDNPAAVVGGTSRSGANPGRAGVNVGVGATHQLNESWSVNAGYNLELVPRATSHNASVGATYRF